jgi:hypothetical protein
MSFVFELDDAQPNIMPSRYRQVSLSTDVEQFDLAYLTGHFVGREAYNKTRFIVARRGDRCALIEIGRAPSDELFSPIEHIRVLAGPEQCRLVVDATIDCGVPSHVARVVGSHRGERCVVVEGMYSHVSFIMNPAPLRVRVLDVVPPFPSKLVDQTARVIDVAEDLGPVVLVEDTRDSRELYRAHQSTLAGPSDGRDAVDNDQLLVPCRGSGVEIEGCDVSYLDEHPSERDWTLLGCQRSQQIHHWFFGRDAPIVDTCPRQFLVSSESQGTGDDALPTLTRCCLLQQGMERHGNDVIVPWGASLGEVRRALDVLTSHRTAQGMAWTPT